MSDKTVKFIISISVVLVVLMTQLTFAGSVIYENDFNEESDIAGISTYISGSFTWYGAILTDLYYVSSPKSLRLQAGGMSPGAAGSYLYASLPLGSQYDFYSYGTGEVTVQVSRFSKASYIRIELCNGENVRASLRYDFTDWNIWHELSIPLDGDETDIDTIVFTTYNYQSTTSGTYAQVDDFLVQTSADYCGDYGTIYAPGDINKDCEVNIADLAALASSWLECNDSTNPDCN